MNEQKEIKSEIKLVTLRGLESMSEEIYRVMEYYNVEHASKAFIASLNEVLELKNEIKNLKEKNRTLKADLERMGGGIMTMLEYDKRVKENEQLAREAKEDLRQQIQGMFR